jgi:hypothetical protein
MPSTTMIKYILDQVKKEEVNPLDTLIFLMYSTSNIFCWSTYYEELGIFINK